MLRVEGLEPSTRRLGVGELVLSRALCRYQRFDLERLPATRRRAALKLQLQQWSPFAASDYAVAWQGGMASVWCWDRTAVESALSSAGRRERQRIIPETLLRAPLAQGLRLQRCLDGVEAQHWSEGQLLHSRWWPAEPAAAELLAFQRESSVPPEQQRRSLSAESLDLQAQPWSRFDAADAGAGELAPSEALLYAALALAIGVPALALGITQLRVGSAIRAKQQEIAALRDGSRAVLDARESALSAQARLHAIQSLQHYPEALALMVGVTRALASSDAYVTEWDMSDGHLRILVNSPGTEISGAAYVSALERSGLFGDIKVITQSDPKQMGFTMDLLTRDAARAAQAAASNPQPES